MWYVAGDDYERMTMVGKTTRGAPLARFGVLALALAAFVPLAIPAAASASTDRIAAPLSWNASSSPSEQFVNDVKAVAFPYLKDAFNSNATLDVGVDPTVSADNRAEATTKCSGCTAVALALQMVTTILPANSLHALDVATATSEGCLSDCNAVADAYQIVVATDTPLPLSFSQLLDNSQLQALNTIRVEFIQLESSGLTLAQVQSKAKDLVDQAMTILEAGTYVPASATPFTAVFTVPAFTLPTFSPAAPGVDLGTGSSTTSAPVVTLYKDVKFNPWLAG
jgi:hypothetical protein